MLPARHKDCDVTVKFYTTRSLTQIIFQLQDFKNSTQDIIQFLSFGGIKKKNLPVDLLSSYFFLVNYHFIFLSTQSDVSFRLNLDLNCSTASLLGCKKSLHSGNKEGSGSADFSKA
jgi:hypothetical protein